jgi:hypothetical protein
VRHARLRWWQSDAEHRQEAAEQAAQVWFAYRVERGDFHGLRAWLLTPDRRLLAATPALLECLGVDLETFLSWSAEAMIPPDQRPVLRRDWATILALPFAEGEFELWAGDRRIGPFHARLAIDAPYPGVLLNTCHPIGSGAESGTPEMPRVMLRV